MDEDRPIEYGEFGLFHMDKDIGYYQSCGWCPTRVERSAVFCNICSLINIWEKEKPTYKNWVFLYWKMEQRKMIMDELYDPRLYQGDCPHDTLNHIKNKLANDIPLYTYEDEFLEHLTEKERTCYCGEKI